MADVYRRRNRAGELRCGCDITLPYTILRTWPLSQTESTAVDTPIYERPVTTETGDLNYTLLLSVLIVGNIVYSF